MRQIVVQEFGGPEVLVVHETAVPVAGPGEVVVEVAVVDTLFVETVIRRGDAGSWFNTRPPYTPGGAVAGTVVSAGRDVDPGWVGRRVVASLRGGGGYAEQVVVGVDGVVAVPDGIGSPDAVALASDGVTALAILDGAAIRPGDRVLVVGATGGMGALLVQLAGQHVIAAARGRAKLDLARELGAAEVVDCAQPGWAARVTDATGGAGADVVLDGVGGGVGLEAFGATADGGRFSAHGAPAGDFAAIDPAEAARRGITVRGIADVQLDPAERTSLLRRVLDEAAAGRVRPAIGQTYPLDRAADAHAAIEARTVTGKTLLTVQRSGSPASTDRTASEL